jgi:hypothetical protein
VTRRSTTVGVGLAIVLGMVAACDRSPTRPGAVVPPGSPSVAVVRVEIAGPESLAPGSAVQFRAVAHLADGTSREVTTEAGWHSSNAAVLGVSTDGTARGYQAGEAHVRTAYMGVISTREVLILPEGTFRLSGRVTEADIFPGIVGARVEAVSAAQQSLSTMTDATGRYRLYGVPPEFELRVSKDAYHDHLQRLVVAGHQTVDFQLRLVTPRPDVSGSYTLAIAVGPDCGAALPEEARSRRYAAALTQSGGNITVVLFGASFLASDGSARNRFSGTLDPSNDQISFHLREAFDDYYYYYPNVVERLAEAAFFVPSGRVQSTRTAPEICGELTGLLEVKELLASGRLRRVASCVSSSHQFTLSRENSFGFSPGR